MKFPVYKRVCLWNVLSKKCHAYETSYLWNVLSTKRLIYETSYLWNVLSMKRIISELQCKWNVMSMKCNVCEMSCPIIFFWGGATHVPPTQELLGGGQTLNCKLKTFCFLDTLKVHVQSKTLASTTLSPLKP